MVIFIANLGCKKAGVGGGGLCACSPISTAPLILVIKNNADVDLLNPSTSGYFDKNQIQLFSKDANNVVKKIQFEIRPPFSFGNNQKIDYYQLTSYEIPNLAKSIESTFYLKLGDNKLYELNLKVNNNLVEKLLIDKTEAAREVQPATNSYFDGIYKLKI